MEKNVSRPTAFFMGEYNKKITLKKETKNAKK